MEISNKKSIVFLHGNSCSSDYFVYQKESPLLKKFDLHFINYSNSKNCSISALAENVLSKINELKLENVVLAGHSLGGHIAIRVLSLDRENIIKGLFVWGTPIFGNTLCFDLAFNQIPELNLLFQESLSFNEILSLYSIFFAHNSTNVEREMLIKMLENSSGFFRKTLGTSLALEKHFDELKFISSISIPHLIAFGSEDKIMNESYIESTLKDLNIINLKGSHSFHLDNFEEFNEVLFEFTKNLVFNNRARFNCLGKYNEFNREY